MASCGLIQDAVCDGSLFLGSMNLDLRSAKLNTEMGVIIDSPQMAQQLTALSDNGSSYRVRLNAATRDIEWVEQGDDG